MEAQNSTRSRPQSKVAEGGGASIHLANLPSRGFFSSTVLSSNLGGLRIYVCDHDTSPPEEQIIKTNTTDILIRALQLNKQKSDLKDTSKVNNKGKRSAGKALEERTPAKRANNAGSSSSSQPEGSTSKMCEKALQKMTVERLRDLLKKKELPVKGKKDELILRLMNGA